jgi:hypothetical protein
MLLLAAALLLQAPGPPAQVAPVLAFPEPGLDDPAAYEGYRTRFYRDSRGNTLQVYLDQRDGRVVNVWADAVDESLGFTLRTPAGRPAELAWAGDDAEVEESGGMRTVQYRLRVPAAVDVGHFLLGSMRLERDFQYAAGHRAPFGAVPMEIPELTTLLQDLRRLDEPERRRQLALLNAASVEELQGRLRPTVSVERDGEWWSVRAGQTSFDGRSRLALELRVPAAEATVERRDGAVSIRSRSGGPLSLVVRVGTDAPALTPLRAPEIFAPAFLEYYGRRESERDSLARLDRMRRSAVDSARIVDFRRMEREVLSLELLASREKLMAGLPNYGTYFGRDMLTTALMMESVWSDRMAEYVVSAALRKLSPGGEVSHEEALGGQAIRENAGVYHFVIGEYFAARERGDREAADSSLAQARRVLSDLQRVRENYRMLDDDFQLPVVAARYLADPRVDAARKRAFLDAPVPAQDGASTLSLLLRNLAYVSRMAESYASDPVAAKLVAFPEREDGKGYFPGSWRDSGVGYAGGRYAMDINVVWVPAALRATGSILASLRELGYDPARLAVADRAVAGSPLGGFLRAPESLDRDVAAWSGTASHFRVTLAPDEARERVEARLAAMPPEERGYWSAILRRAVLTEPLTFLALSLDADGRPIPVGTTDVGMRLFVEAPTGGAPSAGESARDVRPVVLPYPIGLMISGLGPVVANDAYAPPAVWAMYERDRYPSPGVVWGREVNLLLLGLARRIEAATDSAGAPRPGREAAVAALGSALREIRDAARASGLRDQELWSYRIEDGRLSPVRYATSTDLQHWNLTDLAVRYELARLPAARPAGAR